MCPSSGGSPHAGQRGQSFGYIVHLGSLSLCVWTVPAEQVDAANAGCASVLSVELGLLISWWGVADLGRYAYWAASLVCPHPIAEVGAVC